ncbi:MAG: [FeFe] hydrogenase H-cluster radical SAM maturase HydG [Candidatus Latescibacter sp.]|nr:[FeFe] hydrogenase H-cluster radical SAM maturase HydG [Candidatus Latescibacter sp.]
MPHDIKTEQIPIIREDEIHSLIQKTEKPPQARVKSILAKALELKGLDLEESSCLLNIRDENLLEELFQTALQVKEQIYGNRLVLFAPLYVSNYCSNNCLYCGFRKDNREMKRKILTIEEIKEEVKIILGQGHKRILMLMGEHPGRCAFDYFLEAVRAVYSVQSGQSSIRRINVEIAPLTLDEFKELKQVKIGTYTVFQETYHYETYKKMHPTGIKADYWWRLTAMDRAQQSGIDDVGIGALFGLYDYRFEVLAMFQHAAYLDKTYGTGPHTISIPRLEPAQNAPVALNPPYPVSDMDFKKLVAVIRVSVPYTGMILSTRESAELRQELLNLGVSQISAGSRTNPGGYREGMTNPEDEEQFTVNDTRSTGEVIKDVIRQGFVPSFCTGCYRMGRTGMDFMDLAKPGLIKSFCLPNALLTLKEYLIDYGDDETRSLGDALIERELPDIPTQTTLTETKARLQRIENGERDIYF